MLSKPENTSIRIYRPQSCATEADSGLESPGDPAPLGRPLQSRGNNVYYMGTG